MVCTKNRCISSNWKKNSIKSTSSVKKPTLQISIPTFNRPEQLKNLLESILDSIKFIPAIDRDRVSVAVYNNSSQDYSYYEEINNDYQKKFSELRINSYDYIFTGFDIGGTMNCTLALLKSNGLYTWFLPDDDLSSIDSISTILEVIDEYKPNMIHGGIMNKTILRYDETKPPKNYVKNGVFAVYSNPNEKEDAILRSELIQAQEHVYKTELYRSFYHNQNFIDCLDDMMPGLFSLICIKNEGCLVMLKESLGLFRDGDPSSGWRHSWPYIALNQWPDNVKNYINAGLISNENEDKAKKIYINLLNELSRRPDILLGLNKNSYLSPYKTYKNFGNTYLKALLFSPINIIKKIITKYRHN